MPIQLFHRHLPRATKRPDLGRGTFTDTAPDRHGNCKDRQMRSAWVYLVAAATLSITGMSIAHLRLSDIPDPAVGYSPQPPLIGRLNDKVIEYQLDGSAGAAVFVSYLDVDGSVQEVSTTLPWQISLHTQQLTVPTGLMAQSENNPLSCRITIDGQVLDETQSGASAVSCKVVVS